MAEKGGLSSHCRGAVIVLNVNILDRIPILCV